MEFRACQGWAEEPAIVCQPRAAQTHLVMPMHFYPPATPLDLAPTDPLPSPLCAAAPCVPAAVVSPQTAFSRLSLFTVYRAQTTTLPPQTDTQTDTSPGKGGPDNGRWADDGGCRLGNRIDMLQCAHWAKCSAHGGGLGPAIRGFGLPIASARPKRETGHLNSFCKGTTDWLAGCR